MPVNVPAGGAEYFATHLKALGSENLDTYVVSAGDLIGGSPLLSGLFHDEPTIEFMNSIGLDTIGVGNHEFDEGKAELLRMQYGNRAYIGGGPNGGTSYTPARLDGCHPVDGCQDGTPFFGSTFQYLAANVTDTSTGNPLLPSYRIVNTSTGEKIAFIGETFKGTPLVVTPTGVAGLDFLDEADTVNALIPMLQQRQVQTFVVLLHQGGFQNAPFSGRLPERRQLRELHRGRARRHRQPAQSGSGRGRERTHARPVHLHDQQPARDERVVLRSRDHLDRPHDRPDDERRRLRDGRQPRGHPDGGEG